MAYRISWFVPGSVVYVALRGKTTAEELRAETSQLIALLDEGEAPLVHLLLDATLLEQFPANVEVLNSAMVDGFRHPILGWTILITESRMVKYLGAMVTGLSNARYRAFESLEDGLAFLNEIDSTLPNLLAHRQDGD